jgi:DedD protein
MEEKNELNDIILNKGGSSGGNKKVVLAIATFAIILIIVVVIMNRLNSGGSDKLPQPVLPPEPTETTGIVKEDPLFEPVEVIEEEVPAEENLDRIAQRLKEESLKEEAAQTPAPAPAAQAEEKPAAAPAKPAVRVQAPKPAPKPVAAGRYYVQVGSFTRYEPNARFLKKITDSGYSYTYHKVTRNGATLNKVLIGPFGSEKEARNALTTIRKNIEPGAFVTKV